jgi:hypothetical protein
VDAPGAGKDAAALPGAAADGEKSPRSARGAEAAVRAPGAAEARTADDTGEEQGDTPAADAGWPSLVPQTVRDLLDRLPGDARAADMAIQGFLAQVELLGGAAPGRGGPRALLSWVLAGVALGSAFEAARRRPRRAMAGVPAEESTWSWWTDTEGSWTGRRP